MIYYAVFIIAIYIALILIHFFVEPRLKARLKEQQEQVGDSFPLSPTQQAFQDLHDEIVKMRDALFAALRLEQIADTMNRVLIRLSPKR